MSILAVGTAFGEADCSSWNPKYASAVPPSRIVQIDIDPEEIGKDLSVQIGIVGDAKTTLRQLIDALGPEPRPAALVSARGRSYRARRRGEWRQELKQTQEDDGTPIHPARLLMELSKAAPKDAIFVTDVGWNKNGAGQQLTVESNASFITSGGFATMRIFPAARSAPRSARQNAKSSDWWATGA